MVIAKKPGEIFPNLYMIDTMQFNVSHITSVFCYYDGENALLMDVGTSDNVSMVIRSLKKNKIPLEHLRGITLTHYHFDHAGGTSKLWKKIAKKVPDFKIYTTKLTKHKLQNADSHVTGARTTFNGFVGSMKPIPEDFAQQAYEVLDENKTDSIMEELPIPIDFSTGAKIKLIPTPGHSPDHVAPAIFFNSSNQLQFLFGGEAIGTFYHESELISAATSMPPNFQYQIYMNSLKRIQDLNPEILGVCHYGALKGTQAVRKFLDNQANYMESLMNSIKRHYDENPSVRYIIEQLEEEGLHVKDRVGDRFTDNPVSKRFLSNLQLALTYGILIDLGYRKSKYEERMVN